jgi:hypothetical protein
MERGMTEPVSETPPAPAPRHSRTGLFAPFGIALAALALWTVWWVILIGRVETRVTEGIDGLRAAGWTVRHGGLDINGWPFRASVTVRHLHLVSPSGQGVSAPELAAEAMAWNPDRWVLVARDGLVLARGDKGKVAVDAPAIRASVSGLGNPYPNLAIELAQPRFTPLPGAEPFPITSAERFEIYLRPHAGREGGPAVAQPAGDPADAADVLVRLIEAQGREGGPVAAVTRGGALTVQGEAVVARARDLSGPDVAGVTAAWARGGGALLDLRGELTAGDSRAQFASPRLAAGPDGRLEGRVSLTARDAAGAISGLTGEAPAAVEADTAVELPLVFADGQTRLGPFVVAPAPKLF